MSGNMDPRSGIAPAMAEEEACLVSTGGDDLELKRVSSHGTAVDDEQQVSAPLVASPQPKCASPKESGAGIGRAYREDLVADEAAIARNNDKAARAMETPVDQPHLSVLPPPKPHAVPAHRVRLHKVWPGSNRFFCSGMLMTGSPMHECSTAGTLYDCATSRGGQCCPSISRPLFECLMEWECLNAPVCTRTSPVNLCTWIWIFVPSALYFKIAFTYLWVKVHFLVPLSATFFFVTTVCCLIAACMSDPGIIPRREVILATGAAAWLEHELGYNPLGINHDSSSASISPEQRRMGYKWCSTCRIVRPPRASHCPDCDNCVLRFDHHCPFINNCVGQRNYLFFVSFVTSVCCLALLVIPMLLWTVSRLSDASEEETASEMDGGSALFYVLITVGAAAACGGLMVLLLWGYHMFLICTGMTTKEHWKGRVVDTSNRLPGLGDELTVCARRGPRLFNPRAWVKAVEAPPEDGLFIPGLRRKWMLRNDPEDTGEV